MYSSCTNTQLMHFFYNGIQLTHGLICLSVIVFQLQYHLRTIINVLQHFGGELEHGGNTILTRRRSSMVQCDTYSITKACILIFALLTRSPAGRTILTVESHKVTEGRLPSKCCYLCHCQLSPGKKLWVGRKSLSQLTKCVSKSNTTLGSNVKQAR